MPAVNPSPLGVKFQRELADGTPAVGYQLFSYVAGSVNTKQDTFTDSTGTVANTNPIVLDSLGQIPLQLWYQQGLSYKAVFAPANDTDPPSSPIWSIDNLIGINDSVITQDQWVASNMTPTFVSATSFTVPGDQTSIFQAGRRLKTINSSGTIYSTVTSSAFGGGLTTVTVVNDSGVLDSGLSTVFYSVLSAASNALPDFGEAVSVLEKGAFNGVDDTSAIVAAIATGRDVLIPAKYTFITQGLTLANANQTIFIRGIVKLKDSTNQSVFNITANGVKVIFQGGAIDGNKANQTTVVDSLGSGIWLANGISDVEIRDHHIYDSKRNNIAGFGNNNDVQIIGGKNRNAAFIGIYPSQSSAAPSKRWHISGITFSGWGQDGIGTVGLQYSTIIGNRFIHPSDDVAVAGIALEAECNFTTVVGNTFEGTCDMTHDGNGVQVNDCHHVTVTGNTFDGLGQAVDCHGSAGFSHDVTVSNNVIDDCGYSAAAIIVSCPTSGTNYRAVITGNVINNSPAGAIHVTGVSHNIVSNNMINGVNLQNIASKSFVSAINLTSQAYFNTITNNVIMEGTGGFMKIGIHEYATSAGENSGVNTIRDNRIVGADFDILCGGTAYNLTVYSKVTRTLDTAVTAAPTTGHWERGDQVLNEQTAAGGAPGWVCTTTGTFSATTTTGNITTGTNQLTVASATGLYSGMAIRVAGAGIAGGDHDTFIAVFDGTGLTCTLRDNAPTTVVGAVVSTPAALNPVFKAMANVAA